MTVLLDMNLSPRWVEALAKEGIHAIHWATIGQANDPDSKIIAVAQQSDYVLLTQDLDFGSLLAATKWHKPSVIQLRTEELSPDVIGKQVCQVFKQLQSELEQGVLITFDPRRTRVRVLPLS
jgi:predicted nuclease of predicted toxin-antitoxin system